MASSMAVAALVALVASSTQGAQVETSCVRVPGASVPAAAKANGTSSWRLPTSTDAIVCSYDHASMQHLGVAVTKVPANHTLMLILTRRGNRNGTVAQLPHRLVWSAGPSAAVYLVPDWEPLGEEAVTRGYQVVALKIVHKLATHAGRNADRADCPAQIRSQLVGSLQSALGFYTRTLEEVSGERPFELNGRATTVTTRYTGTVGNDEAAEHIANICAGLGLETSEQIFSVRGTMTKNIVCVKRGRTSKVVVVGGHYDSTSQRPTTDAPGAIDNGSGSIGALAIAEAVSKSGLEFDATLHFVFFGGEEQGLYGSYHYVEEAAAANLDISYALIMDMIGYSSKFYGVTLEGTNTRACLELMELAETQYVDVAPNLDIATTTVSFGSDHVPFQQAGIPCFLAIELDDVDYPGYHRTTDTVSYMNYGQALDILKGLAATMCAVAGTA